MFELINVSTYKPVRIERVHMIVNKINCSQNSTLQQLKKLFLSLHHCTQTSFVLFTYTLYITLMIIHTIHYINENTLHQWDYINENL